MWKKIIMKTTFVLFALVILITPSSGIVWTCKYENPPYGPIEIKYENPNFPDKGIIYALTPQRHPIIVPGELQLLQLKSNVCEEVKLIIEDTEGNKIAEYSKKADIPFKNCDIPNDADQGMINAIKRSKGFLTYLFFKAPTEEGEYYLKLFDTQNNLLRTGVIEVPSLDSIAKVTSREAYCNNSPTNFFTIELIAPHPVIVKDDSAGEVQVTIREPSTSEIEKIFENITVSFTTSESVGIELQPKEGITCSDDECTKTYLLPSSISTSGILTVWEDLGNGGRSSLNSMVVSVVDANTVVEISNKLDRLYNTSEELERRYSKEGIKEKSEKWGEIKEELVKIKEGITSIKKILDKQKLTLRDVKEVVNNIDNCKENLNRLSEKIGGIL